MKLTPAQEKTLVFIAAFVAENRYAPTLRDICNHLGFSSCNAANSLVCGLVRHGAVTKKPMLSRSLTITEEGREHLRYVWAEQQAKVQLG